MEVEFQFREKEGTLNVDEESRLKPAYKTRIQSGGARPPSPYRGELNVLNFNNNDDTILSLIATDILSARITNYKIQFYGDFLLSEQSAFEKKPFSALKEAQSIMIREPGIMEFSFPRPESTTILGGNVICVINSVITLEFSIPSQMAQPDGRFDIPDISYVFHTFK